MKIKDIRNPKNKNKTILRIYIALHICVAALLVFSAFNFIERPDMLLSLLAGIVFALTLTNVLLKNRNKNRNRMVLASILAITVFVLPVMFFKYGGICSGVPVWFVFALILTFLQPEKRPVLFIMVMIESAAVAATYIIAASYPELVADVTGIGGNYVISAANTVICGLLTGMLCWRIHTEFVKIYSKAREINEAKTMFLSQMSHEIRTPINTILGLDELILREYSHDEKLKKYAADIQSSSEVLVSMINDILDMSRLVNGQLVLREKRYKTADLVSYLLNSIKPRAEKAGLELKIEADSNLPCELEGDDTRIRQVVLNLLSNAVKFTSKGSITLRIEGEKKKNKDFILRIEVQDTGIGIKGDEMDKLFVTFNWLESTRKNAVEGTGLGLPIARGLVGMMDGDLSIHSVYGEGSTFTVKIPQKVADSTPMGSLSSAGQCRRVFSAGFTAPKASVLLVDDNEMNLRVAEGLLSPYQMRIDTASSGREALEKLESGRRYDLILLDFMMPGMNGIETCREIRAMRGGAFASLPIIALTANAISDAKDMLLSEGMQDYISKPIDVKQLDESLRKWLPKEKLMPPVLVCERPARDVITGMGGQNLINRETGLRYAGGNSEMYKRFLGIFADNYASEKAKFEKAFSSGNWSDYAIEAHSLKSTSRGIGAEALSDAALALETAGKAGDGEKIKANHAALIAAYTAVYNAIRNEIPALKSVRNDFEKIAITRSELAYMIKDFCEILKDLDIDGANKKLENLKRYEYSGLAIALEDVERVLVDFSFDEAEKIMRVFTERYLSEGEPI